MKMQRWPTVPKYPSPTFNIVTILHFHSAFAITKKPV